MFGAGIGILVSLRLLHLSDIHFHVPQPGWHEIEDLENEVLRDVSRAVQSGREIDAILIGGDIAFSASREEYAVASSFIGRLCEAAGGLAPGQVRVVPGNHDVNRSTLSSSVSGWEFRAQLANAEPEGVNLLLHERLADDPGGQGLLAPLDEYNIFAEGYGCGTSSKRLAWEDDSLAVDGWPVRLVGINSAINSGPGDRHGSLVVGSHQCRIPRDGASVRVLMLHHPPRWLKDWGVVEGFVRRSHLVLFGHEHAMHAQQLVPRGTVEVSAGALSPEMDSQGLRAPYVPTYNFIEMSRTEDDLLQVTIEARTWHAQRTEFESSEGVRTYEVSLEPAIDPSLPDLASSEEDALEMSDAAPLVSPAFAMDGRIDDEEAERRTALRNAGVAFLQLQPFKRIEVARRLGVLSDEDARIPLGELGGTILERIQRAGLTEALILEMSS